MPVNKSNRAAGKRPESNQAAAHEKRRAPKTPKAGAPIAGMKIALCHAIIGYYKDNIMSKIKIINAVRRYLRDLHKRLVGRNFKKRTVTPFHLREWARQIWGRGHTANTG